MKSRKFILTILGLLLITLVALVGIKYQAIEGVYPTFMGGVMGILGLYFSGNVVNKHVIGNQQVKMEAAKNGNDNGGKK